MAASLQVRKSQHSGMACWGSHVEKVAHRNIYKNFNMNQSRPDRLQQKLTFWHRSFTF